MFSGIKSIFFGYTEPSALATTSGSNDCTDESSAALSNELTSKTIEKTCFSQETSALLEQTLNAATTKFTEQLLPQSASIEQLQSSSHQLLPSLNEQHEEDEFNKNKKFVNEAGLAEVNKEANVDAAAADDDDDDECFNAESWELLDLVERQPEAECSLKNSTVHDDATITVKASGILKYGSKDATQFKDLSAPRVQNQKHKVSFETPDLVNDKQEIDRIAPKENTKSGLKVGRNKKKNDNKKAQKLIAPNLSSNSLSTSSTERKKEIVNVAKLKDEGLLLEPGPSRQALFEKTKLESSQVENVTVKGPVLNYAAALSSKLENNQVKDSSFKKSEVFTEKNLVNMQLSGALKRVRPLSTSSWSSSDEIEAIDTMWNDIHEESRDGPLNVVASKEDVNEAAMNDDTGSIVSSGFSDCDYGYEGLNDFIMRPKKAQGKKRRGLSAGSNSLLSSMSKRGGDLAVSSRKSSIDSSSTSANNLSEPKVTNSKTKLSKGIKPKKKKLVLSAPSNSCEFLKKRSTGERELTVSTSCSSVETRVERDVTAEEHLEVIQEPLGSSAQMASSNAAQLMPPPPLPNTTSSSASGNDSSDLADMDESWYVTPPPCFTGSNKFSAKTKPKAKEAARENALIEHPSIYIASTSKQPHKLNMPATSSNEKSITARCPGGSSNCDSSSNDGILAKSRAIVLRKVSSKQQLQVQRTSTSAISSSGSGLDLKKKSTPKKAASVNEKKDGKEKAWGNKFIVTNWAYDDQDDINDDFDNLFEADDLSWSPKSTKTTKKKPALRSSESPSLLDISAGYESDISIPAPALVGITDNSSEFSNEPMMASGLMATDNSNLELEPKVTDENLKPNEGSKRQTKSQMNGVERKAPVQVRPIEPERQPGWQLRRKRSRRRPLSASMANTCSAAAGIKHQIVKMNSPKGEQVGNESSTSSGQSSARSTPTLIDRIGSSIVANLTNLTSGFPGGALPIQARTAMEVVEKLNQSVAKKSSADINLMARRRMSKAFLDRQNDCAKLSGSNRRADRRLKMHSTPNGYSINRKVQTNFH